MLLQTHTYVGIHSHGRTISKTIFFQCFKSNAFQLDSYQADCVCSRRSNYCNTSPGPPSIHPCIFPACLSAKLFVCYLVFTLIKLLTPPRLSVVSNGNENTTTTLYSQKHYLFIHSRPFKQSPVGAVVTALAS